MSSSRASRPTTTRARLCSMPRTTPLATVLGGRRISGARRDEAMADSRSLSAPRAACMMLVRIEPGNTAVTPIVDPANSPRSASVNERTAPFERA